MPSTGHCLGAPEWLRLGVNPMPRAALCLKVGEAKPSYVILDDLAVGLNRAPNNLSMAICV